MVDFEKYLSYDPESGVFKNKVSRGRAKKGNIAGSIDKNGYLKVKVEGVDYYLHRIAYYLFFGGWPYQVDHRNQDKTDNRAENLRASDHSDNCCNKTVQSNNTTGMKGVSYHKASGLWRSEVQKGGVRYSCGYHKTPESAADAADKKRIELHGEFFCNHRKTATTDGEDT